MVDPIIAFTLFDKVLAGIGLLREGKKDRTEKTDLALFALYAALAETKSYISERSSGEPRSKVKEFAIAKLWHAASVPLREIDKEFSQRCFLKGGYWMDPDSWDDKSIREKGIAIDAVFEQTRTLLAS